MLYNFGAESIAKTILDIRTKECGEIYSKGTLNELVDVIIQTSDKEVVIDRFEKILYKNYLGYDKSLIDPEIIKEKKRLHQEWIASKAVQNEEGEHDTARSG